MNQNEIIRLIELAYLYLREMRECIKCDPAGAYTKRRAREAYQLEQTLDEFLKYSGRYNHVNGLNEYTTKEWSA